MGVISTINKIKFECTKHPMVNMASVGDISLYEDKATIKYPYINLDVVNTSIRDYVQTYTFRIYVCDRNNPYIAYNKCEVIMNNILKAIDIQSYTIEFFTLNFADIVNGCFTDFQIQVPLEGSCTYDSLFNSFLLLEDSEFIMLESGDLIRKNN